MGKPYAGPLTAREALAARPPYEQNEPASSKPLGEDTDPQQPPRPSPMPRPPGPIRFDLFRETNAPIRRAYAFPPLAHPMYNIARLAD